MQTSCLDLLWVSLHLACECESTSETLFAKSGQVQAYNNNNNKIVATGIVTRSLRKNLESVPRKYSIDSLQKTAILGTSHIIGKVLQCEA